MHEIAENSKRMTTNNRAISLDNGLGGYAFHPIKTNGKEPEMSCKIQDTLTQRPHDFLLDLLVLLSHFMKISILKIHKHEILPSHAEQWNRMDIRKLIHRYCEHKIKKLNIFVYEISSHHAERET
ncbi:CLUMA_CG007176, isoform A [Clunio marinus]|uniref:CLUMA_CG007176, isoform A n=1 Tax=Clunio marinus TaxID=568069 RepID=A0A1J1HZX0_9DIPT|nr:CLUMA_CG007176, isoform A [Clunio marinus]